MSDIFREVNQKEASEMLDKITLFRHDALLWKKGESEKFSVEMSDYDINDKTMHLQSSIRRIWFNDEEVLLNFKHDDLQYFISGRIKKLDDKNFNFTLSGPLYKCDKRQNLRIERGFFNTLSIFFEAEGEEFDFSIENVSVGGMALRLKNEDWKRLEKHKVIIRPSLSINEDTIMIKQMTIKHCRQHENLEDQVIIGIQFTDLGQTEESILFREINQALFKRFGKLAA